MNILLEYRGLCAGHFGANDRPAREPCLPRAAPRPPPAARPAAAFRPGDHRVDHDDEGRQHEHAGEHAGDVEHAFRLLDQIAEPRRGTEIFADHRAHHGKADRGVQRGEHPGQRRRPIDVAHQLPLVHAEHARIGEHGGRDFLDALIDVEEHDEEHQRDAERHLRPDAQGPSHSVKIGASTTRGSALTIFT